MTLNRIPIPSPNYSSRGGATVRLIVVHTAEGALNFESLGAFFADPASGVSSHVGIDDTPGTVGEYVRRDGKAWTQANANPFAVAAELCGFAAWNSAMWDTHPTMLENVAAWIAEEAAAFHLPIIKLSPADAQAGAAGVCAHSDLGAWGGNHSDPGPAFPWDRVLVMAAGAVPTPTPPPGPAGTAPPWPGTYLADYTEGHGTAQWQAQMRTRGWPIDVDDCYGPASARVCWEFQVEKQLGADGVVGPLTWDATFTLPVT